MFGQGNDFSANSPYVIGGQPNGMPTSATGVYATVVRTRWSGTSTASRTALAQPHPARATRTGNRADPAGIRARRTATRAPAKLRPAIHGAVPAAVVAPSSDSSRASGTSPDPNGYPSTPSAQRRPSNPYAPDQTAAAYGVQVGQARTARRTGPGRVGAVVARVAVVMVLSPFVGVL